MANASARLEIQISAKNAASPVLKNVGKDLSELDKYAGNAAKGLAGLAVAGGVAGLAALAVNAGQAVYDLAELGAQTKRLETSFASLASRAGENSVQMLDAMREAARGTIENTDLMLAANTALMLGVADSTEEMVGLLEVAAARGKAFGVSTSEAFAALTQGLGRMSPEILNNIGIVINAEKTYADFAKQLGLTADQLSEQQRMQALVNETMRTSADLVKENQAAGPDDADKLERGATAWANLWAEIGKNQAGMVAQTAEEFAFVAEGLAHFASEAGRVEQQLATARQNLEYFQNAAEASGTVSEELARILAAGGTEVAALQAKLILLTGGLDASSGGTAELRGEFQMLGPAAVTTGDGLTALELKAQNLARGGHPYGPVQCRPRDALAGIESAAIGAIHSAASAAVGILPSVGIARIYGDATKNIHAQREAMFDGRHDR